MENITDLQCGKAAEYLVCADLIMAGYIAFPSDQGLAFDVVAEVGGRLAKIQVKSTRAVRSIPQRAKHHSGYMFHVRRGKGNTKRYQVGDVDIFALVAMDSREIGYIAAGDIKRTMIFRSPLLKGEYHGEKLTERDAVVRDLRAGGMSYREIGKKVGMDNTTAHRICTKINKFRGRHLRDYLFASAAKSAGFEV